jgi:hypothetical protein
MSEPVVPHGHNAMLVQRWPPGIAGVYCAYGYRYRHRFASYVDPTSLSRQTRILAIWFHAEPGCARFRFRPDHDLATPTKALT